MSGDYFSSLLALESNREAGERQGADAPQSAGSEFGQPLELTSDAEVSSAACSPGRSGYVVRMVILTQLVTIP
jgi:hypothetical protein